MKNELDAIKEIIKSIQYLTTQATKDATKIYNGLVLQEEDKNTWRIKINDRELIIPLYGNNTPSINKIVKVFIPQGNYNLAFFI